MIFDYEKYLQKQTKLIVFMLENGFSKEETIAAVNAIRLLVDLELIVKLGD
jgi:hypothetical protein